MASRAMSFGLVRHKRKHRERFSSHYKPIGSEPNDIALDAINHAQSIPFAHEEAALGHPADLVGDPGSARALPNWTGLDNNHPLRLLDRQRPMSLDPTSHGRINHLAKKRQHRQPQHHTDTEPDLRPAASEKKTR